VAETLQSRLQPPLSRWANQLLQETNRLINLVQNLLDLSRMDSTASQPLNYKSVALKGLIDSVWQTLEPLAQQKQLNLIYSGNDAIAVRAEESRLHRVFLNLFDNSIKYSPPGASILVEINLVGSTAIQINVIDSGSGFPETDLPHVFDRLYRGDPARARQFTPTNLENSGDSATSNRISISQLPINNGHGLGLSIVQQIVFAHGGTIQAKNHPQTGGAWLQIELPL
jgi:two-component system phosphate regulon sensor histidine kinase PhoR